MRIGLRMNWWRRRRRKLRVKGVWRRLQRHSSQLCRSSRRAREGLTRTVRVSCTANPLSVLFLILQLDTFIPIPAPSPLPSTRSRLVSLLFVEHFLLIYAEQRTIVSPCFAAAGGVEVGRDCCAECDEEGRDDEMECRRRDGLAHKVQHHSPLHISQPPLRPLTPRQPMSNRRNSRLHSPQRNEEAQTPLRVYAARVGKLDLECEAEDEREEVRGREEVDECGEDEGC
ncbi:hypothetical protein BJY59DRAFT_239751 [Rhodotorula toruloides]